MSGLKKSHSQKKDLLAFIASFKVLVIVAILGATSVALIVMALMSAFGAG